MYKREYIEYLEDKKKEIEDAEDVNELVIEYSMCKITIKYENRNGEYVEQEIEDDKEIIFKNMGIKIEKY